MEVYKFIKIRCKDQPNIGYLVSNLFRLYPNRYMLKIFGIRYVKERLDGWTMWWTINKYDYNLAIKKLNELSKDYKLEYYVSM